MTLLPSTQLPGVIAALLLMTSCASPTPAVRDAYLIDDSIGEIDPDWIVGHWRLSVLNPLQGQQHQSTEMTYHNDGTVEGTLRLNDQAGTLRNQRFIMAGRWHVEGERIVHTGVSFDSATDSPVARAMSQLFNRHAKPGTANVVEVSPTHLVMVGDDDQAIRYTRVNRTVD